MENLLDNDIEVGRIERSEKFEEAGKPQMFKLGIDLGDREVRVAGFKSEVLTVGVPDEEGNPVLVVPEKDVPEGGELY